MRSKVNRVKEKILNNERLEANFSKLAHAFLYIALDVLEEESEEPPPPKISRPLSRSLET